MDRAGDRTLLILVGFANVRAKRDRGRGVLHHRRTSTSRIDSFAARRRSRNVAHGPQARSARTILGRALLISALTTTSASESSAVSSPLRITIFAPDCLAIGTVSLTGYTRKRCADRKEQVALERRRLGPLQINSVDRLSKAHRRRFQQAAALFARGVSVRPLEPDQAPLRYRHATHTQGTSPCGSCRESRRPGRATIRLADAIRRRSE